MTYDELKSSFASSVPLSDEVIARLHRYATLLKEWNEKMNLTAIVEEDEVVEKHFYDCLLPLKSFSLSNKTVADFGTGAGFPGLVWAIVCPSAHVVLVDATGKKCAFLKEVSKQLALANVEIVNKRAEELHSWESYDVVTARAVAPLNVLLEIAIPPLKVGGTFIAMKSAKGKEELAAAGSALEKLHSKLSKTQEENLPHDIGLRVNYFIEKGQATDHRYPRLWSEIEKKPL